ncbi:hypothetical protein Neosp_003350 [[Neocosmospora] mangrovei]
MYSNLLREPCYASFERISPFCDKGMDNFSLGGIINISGYVFEVDYVYGAANSTKGNFSVAEDPHLGVQLFLDEHTEDGELMSHLSKPDLEGFDRWRGNFSFYYSLIEEMSPTSGSGGWFYISPWNSRPSTEWVI